MKKTPLFYIPVFLLFSAAMTGCGWHRPVLLNNQINSTKWDFKAKGVLAFQFTSPKYMKVTVWMNNLETKERYQIDQGISENPFQILDKERLTEYGKTKYFLNSHPLVYLYELPPGNYELRYTTVMGAPTHYPKKLSVGIKADTFAIEPGTITYIGSINMSVDWGTLGLGFNAKLGFETLDSSDMVFAKLAKAEKFGIKNLSRKKSLVTIRM